MQESKYDLIEIAYKIKSKETVLKTGFKNTTILEHIGCKRKEKGKEIFNKGDTV